MARTKIEQDLLDMLAAEKQRTATATTSSLPDIPAGLFGEEPAGPRTKQASTIAAMSDDAYLNFLRPESPGRNVAEIGLDALWQTSPPLQVEAADDGLSSLWTSTPTAAPAAPAVEDDLSALWGNPTASDPVPVEPELTGIWDTPGRSATAEDASDALSGLFMNFDARAQAEITGEGAEFDIPLPPLTRTASTRGEFNIEFDSDMNFEGPVRTGGGSAPRYRIDRPPPTPTFSRGAVTAQDGVVVGQRGSDGRFQRTASVRQPPQQVASRSEAVARYESRQAPQAPAPRAEPTRYVAPATKYDVLRKGGLDL